MVSVREPEACLGVSFVFERFFCRLLADELVLITKLLAYREPLLYNLSVGRELLKQVYLAERLQPPTSFSTITKAYQEIWQRVSNQAYWREILRTGEYKRVGVYALEAYGIFKVCLLILLFNALLKPFYLIRLARFLAVDILLATSWNDRIYFIAHRFSCIIIHTWLDVFLCVRVFVVKAATVQNPR